MLTMQLEPPKVVEGRFFWLGVVGLGGVVSRCPIGGSRGRRPCFFLAGEVAHLGGLGAWLHGCMAATPASRRSPWLAGVRSWGGEGCSAVSGG